MFLTNSSKSLDILQISPDFPLIFENRKFALNRRFYGFFLLKKIRANSGEICTKSNDFAEFVRKVLKKHAKRH